MKYVSALLFVLVLGSCASARSTESCSASARGCEARFRALRLRPGDDLRAKLEEFVRQRGIQAGFVASCSGSLRVVAIRFADQKNTTSLAGPFEIVSLSGTFSPDGSHLHISVADGTGRTVGGHLGVGSTVYTTAEIVVGDIEGSRFRREIDPATTYKELATD
jgi:predicted DNA-binding protein with PD1-like motif